jgi:hypothetical protein
MSLRDRNRDGIKVFVKSVRESVGIAKLRMCERNHIMINIHERISTQFITIIDARATLSGFHCLAIVRQLRIRKNLMEVTSSLQSLK